MFCVQRLMKDAEAAFVSASGDEVSIAVVREFHFVYKTDLETSLSASKKRLSYAERLIYKFEHNKDNLDDLLTRVDGAEAKLESPEGPDQFLEDKVSELGSQLVEKDAVLSGYRERMNIVEENLANVSDEVKRLTT